MRRRHFSGSDFSMTFLRPCAPWSSYRNNRGFSLPNRQSTIRSGTARLVDDVSGTTWPPFQNRFSNEAHVADRVDHE